MVFENLVKRIKQFALKEEYPNRFLKFYHLNKNRLLTERKSSYTKHKKNGICVRCKKPSLPTIVFCTYHKQKHKGYNKKARRKK